MTRSDRRRLEGQVAVVTGASRGIGHSIAEAFAREGATVVVNSRDDAACRQVASELGGASIGIAADVSTPAGARAVIDQTIMRFGRIDNLVCNAGRSIVKNAIDLEPEEWRAVLSLNLDGVFYCAQRAGREMLSQGSGNVIMVASITSFNAFPKRVAYNCSKAAVAMLTKVLAVEWAPNVRVNAVAPGYVRTALTDELEAKGEVDFEAIRGRTPMNRLGEAGEVADAAIFLASEEARYITGQTLAVDGGWTAYGFI